ncbi:MAG: hypothetical protein IT464_13450 [Planctomycetes bacterium]|nr:hypothetical protein [Planctomycetota bacterium]
MDRVLPIVAAAFVGMMVGATAVWLLMDTSSDPGPAAATNAADKPAPQAPSDPEPDPVLERALADANAAVNAKRETDRELAKVRSERDSAAAEVTQLKQEVERLKVEAAKPAPAPAEPDKTDPPKPSSVPIAFGKWAEMPAIRDANWDEIGGAAREMVPLLKELAEAMAAGKSPPPALMQKIGEHNRKLVNHYAKVMGSLPTHASSNGEFTHPINLANMLATQLKGAGKPLSDQQVSELVKLGDEYDRRWDELQKGYNEGTFKLQKKLDEADLKEWFKAEMLRVCSVEQRMIAVPPEVDGIVGLDLYSSGLIFQMAIEHLTAADQEALKSRIKAAIAEPTGIDPAVLDTAQFVFDDWLNGLQAQLAPRTRLQLQLFRTTEVIQSGKAQLKAFKVLHSDYALGDEAKDVLKGAEAVVLPHVLTE